MPLTFVAHMRESSLEAESLDPSYQQQQHPPLEVIMKARGPLCAALCRYIVSFLAWVLQP